MSPEIRQLLDLLGPDNWAEVRPRLFEAAIAAGLDSVEVEGLLREAAKRSGSTLEAMRKSFTDYLGPIPQESEKVAARLVRLALDSGLELWHDPEHNAWASLHDGHRENWPVRSRAFRLWLSRLFYEQEGKPPHGQAVQDALNVLEGKALFEGEQHDTSIRVCHQPGEVWLDLGTPDWGAVRVTAQGWQVVPAEAAPRFRRSKSTGQLPPPKAGRALATLLEPWDLGEGQFALVVAWLLGTLSPGPYPVLALTGEQGSGKSTLARFLRAVIDPGGDLVSMPKDSRDLFITARNSHVLAFDNVSGISPWLSDDLCKLSTGGALRTRELYTNEEETLLQARRPIILNGITDFVTRQDLLDRATLIALRPIEGYQPEGELWEGFHRLHPQALAELLDLTALALRELHRTPAPNVRMADFARWALAAEAGYAEPGAFLDAFLDMRYDSVLIALDADPVYPALSGLLEAQGGSFKGSAADLHEALKGELGDKRPPEGFPRNAHGVAAWLKRTAPALRKMGLEVTPLPREGHERKRGWIITRRPLERVGAQMSAMSADGRESRPGLGKAADISLGNQMSAECPQTSAECPQEGDADISSPARTFADIYPNGQMSAQKPRAGRHEGGDADIADISSPNPSNDPEEGSPDEEGGDTLWI